MKRNYATWRWSQEKITGAYIAINTSIIQLANGIRFSPETTKVYVSSAISRFAKSRSEYAEPSTVIVVNTMDIIELISTTSKEERIWHNIETSRAGRAFVPF